MNRRLKKSDENDARRAFVPKMVMVNLERVALTGQRGAVADKRRGKTLFMSKTMSETSMNAARSSLNRLIVACQDEVLALNAAVAIVDGSERGSRLRQQSVRRQVFCHDLAVGVVSLGGVSAKRSSGAAKLSMTLHNLKRVLAGPNAGDACKACAHATARSARAYAKALSVKLPDDIRFGLERQHAEIEFDSQELRRLRWGAMPRALPGRDVQEIATATSRRDAADGRALESWSDDGGTGGGGKPQQLQGPIMLPPRLGAAIANR